MDKAKKTFDRLNRVDWRTLSQRDRALLEAFGWITLEADEEPETDLE